MTTFSKISSVNSLHNFGAERHSVFSVPAGILCYAVVNDERCEIKTDKNTVITSFVPHVATALVALARMLPMTQGAGLTKDGHTTLRRGMMFDLTLTRRRCQSGDDVVGEMLDWQEYGFAVQEEVIAAVILSSVPLAAVKTGKDTVDYSIRRGHVVKALTEMREFDPLYTPYPVLRVPYQVLNNPWTGTPSDGKWSNALTWQLAERAAGQWQSTALVVRPLDAWTISDSSMYWVDHKDAREFIKFDINDI